MADAAGGEGEKSGNVAARGVCAPALSDKKRRKRKKQPCREYAMNGGVCEYGEECKFSHEISIATTGPVVMPSLPPSLALGKEFVPGFGTASFHVTRPLKRESASRAVLSRPQTHLETGYAQIAVRAQDGSAQTILVHPNGLCVVCWSPAENTSDNNIIKRIAFDPSVTSMQISGKRKRGAAKIFESDVLCTVHMVSEGKGKGDEIAAKTVARPVYACIRGSVLEINKNLMIHPELIASEPARGGFVAIIRPSNNFFLSMGLRWDH